MKAWVPSQASHESSYGDANLSPQESTEGPTKMSPKEEPSVRQGKTRREDRKGLKTNKDNINGKRPDELF